MTFIPNSELETLTAEMKMSQACEALKRRPNMDLSTILYDLQDSMTTELGCVYNTTPGGGPELTITEILSSRNPFDRRTEPTAIKARVSCSGCKLCPNGFNNVEVTLPVTSIPKSQL